MPKFNPISRWSERNQLLVLSLVVGIVVGLAAVLLKTLISVLQEGLRDAFGGVLGGSLYYLALPGIGMLLAMLFCKYVIKDSIGHGVTKALQAVSRHESRIKPHNMWSSVAASSVTIGFGGSVGAEADRLYRSRHRIQLRPLYGIVLQEYDCAAGLWCRGRRGWNIQGSSRRSPFRAGDSAFQHFDDLNDAAAAVNRLSHSGFLYSSWLIHPV